MPESTIATKVFFYPIVVPVKFKLYILLVALEKELDSYGFFFLG